MKRLAAAMVWVGGLAVVGISACTEGTPADSDVAVTAGDQPNTESDLKITQAIRQAVVADKELSVNAHNVKIITANGAVTLRGPVKSSEEKANIGAKAKQVAGVTRVDNQIEIASD